MTNRSSILRITHYFDNFFSDLDYIQSMFSRFRPMSNDQILNVLDHQIQIVKYSDLDEYEHFESLIYPNDGVIVLYETKVNSGHWVLIYFDDDGVVHFFDP